METQGHRSSGYSNMDNLELRLIHHGATAVEIDLINKCYGQQRLGKLKQLIALLCIYLCGYGGYGAAGNPTSVLILVLFFLCLLYIAISTMGLIKSEKLLFCLDFALQLQTERFGSRHSNVFIPASNIYDFVINEVIEDLDIHYILIVRTKGNLFKLQPIIPIFNNLCPSIDCLEFIYKSLNKKCKTIPIMLS